MKKQIVLTFLSVVAFLSCVIAVNAQTQEKKIDTLVADFRVISINSETAIIMDLGQGRFFKTNVEPVLSAFHYVLEPTREFKIALQVDRVQMFHLQTRGQTGIADAIILWFTPTKNQLGKDMRTLNEHIREKPGYDRSPRYAN